MHESTQQRLEELASHGHPLVESPKRLSYSELVRSLAQHFSSLSNKEIQLIKNEVEEIITSEMLMTRRLTIGAGLIAVGSTTVITALVLFLSKWVQPWITALAIGTLFITLGWTIIVAVWKDHTTLEESGRRLKESLKWSTKN